MNLSNNAILIIAGLFLWQVIGLSIGKLLFFVMFGLGLVAANRDQLQGFLFSAQPASLQKYFVQTAKGLMLAITDEVERRKQYTTFQDVPMQTDDTPPRYGTDRKGKIEPYWYVDQYQIKDICGIGQESSLVRSWKEQCNEAYMYDPHVSGAKSPNQKLHYSIEALTSLSVENDCLLPIIEGITPFSYWYRNEGEWQKGSYSPTVG
jgi:hypothetical protein